MSVPYYTNTGPGISGGIGLVIGYDEYESTADYQIDYAYVPWETSGAHTGFPLP